MPQREFKVENPKQVKLIQNEVNLFKDAKIGFALAQSRWEAFISGIASGLGIESPTGFNVFPPTHPTSLLWNEPEPPVEASPETEKKIQAVEKVIDLKDAKEAAK